MCKEFPIVDCSLWEKMYIESVGTREKDWRRDPNGGIWLLKESLRFPTEVWTEKAAAILAERVGLPHATYEIGDRKGVKVSLSRLFLSSGIEALVLGNQLLGIANEEKVEHRREAAIGVHTVERFLQEGAKVDYPRGWTKPVDEWGGAEAMIGYLMFDAWINNTDRHEQNWGVIVPKAASADEVVRNSLAPLFDNSSCLGWTILEGKKEEMLKTMGSITEYAVKSDSEFYPEGKTYQLSTFVAFKTAAYIYPVAAKVWLKLLSGITKGETAHLLNQIPSALASPIELEFAVELLRVNQRRLLEFGPQLRP